MSEFHDDYPQYELMAQHSEAEGGTKRKKLWKVFWILLGITLIELIIGFYNSHFSKLSLMIIFIGFTVLKAFYIVYSFMHLGHEKKVMKWVVIAPFSLFVIYLIFIIATEGSYAMVHRETLQFFLNKP